MIYKNYEIENSYTGSGFIVNYCGDDVIFQTIEAAQSFIDDITEE